MLTAMYSNTSASHFSYGESGKRILLSLSRCWAAGLLEGFLIRGHSLRANQNHKHLRRVFSALASFIMARCGRLSLIVLSSDKPVRRSLCAPHFTSIRLYSARCTAKQLWSCVCVRERGRERERERASVITMLP